MFAFDTNSFSFEYCNPGELALTFLMEDKRLICLTFKGENIQVQEDADYPKFVINQMDYNSDFYYNYLIKLKIIEIEVFSSTIDNSIVDELIIFNCENGKKILLECTICMNGSIKLYFVQQNNHPLAIAKTEKLIKTASFQY